MSNSATLPGAPQVIEGTWEEVSRHADTLAGKRVRLTVLEGDDTVALISAGEQDRLLDELAARHARLPPIPEDAFSRARIYEEHD